MRLNLGCYTDIQAEPGWVNIDLYHQDPDVVVGDVTNLDSRLKNAEEIRAHSILEHLTFAEGEKALADWCNRLAPNGTISIITPNIWNAISLAHQGVEKVTGLLYGKPEEPGQAHKSCWWPDKVRGVLEAHGCEVVEEKDWLDDMWIIAKKIGRAL